jgi:microcystin-dependent protein
MMAAAAKYRDDVAGGIVTTGMATAYAVASYQVFDTLAHLNGQMIAFVPHTTSGATVTLNVDSLGAKPLRASPNVELQGGTLVQGTPYVATYNNSDGAFYLQGFAGNPYLIPLGGLLPYVGASAPNSAFALPYGQAISRTTYATLFSLISTIFGTGDGSTTFNIPDLRGYVLAGVDNMGGSAANRITNAGSGITGTTLGATGGAQNETIARANLPNVDFMADGAGKLPTASSNAITVPGNASSASNFGNAGAVGTAATNVTITGSTPTITMSGHIYLNGNITQTALTTMPPTLMVNYILRII